MLELKNLNLYYNDNHVLKDINMSVKSGACVVLTGKSGSGKSSIINAINNLAVKYNEANITGEILLDDKSIMADEKNKSYESYEIYKLISNVFQNPKTYFFNVNTTEELLFYLENIGLDRKEMNERMNEMLKLFPIAHLLDRDIFKLSGGEKQVLCIASCYIAGSNIILLDEPSSNLDEKYIEILKSMLIKLKSLGKTLILSEHRLYYLMDIADEIYLIDEGRIANRFKSKELLSLSDKELASLGLRSTKKPILTKDNYDLTKGELELKSLNYEVDNNFKLKLSDISFKYGNIYGIIGRNGCGKSTFLRCLIGVEKKSKEEIYENEILNKKARLKKSSLVMQDVNHQLFSDEVEKEVALGLGENKERIDELLKELELYKYKSRHPLSLSGGQKQRLAIASVLYKSSKWIFFDEPTSGMDYTNMKRISKLIKSCSNERNIIFIISHDIEFLNEVADYIINIEKQNKIS
ncbi:MAG: ABC transporter ATP-binding protein [Firmicutes bacterium]|nr:ABC transporter ATP-binding protein [Bacillota bacterium]